MGPEVATAFLDAKHRLDSWQNLKAKLPNAQEQLSRENYQVNHLEYALAAVEQQVHELESFSIGGLLDSLLGRKEEKLRTSREEAERVGQDLEQATNALMAADQEVRRIEEQLTALGEPQRQFNEALNSVETQLLEAGGDGAQELKDIKMSLDFVSAQRRILQKTVQVGKHLIERLHNMTGSVGRTKSKLLHGGPLGVIGNAAVNSVARVGMKGMVQRVKDGLHEFGQCVRGLDLSEGTELDIEISRQGDHIDGFHAQLDANSTYFCDPAVSGPIQDAVQSILGLLEAKLDRSKEEANGLERQRAECIERAIQTNGDARESSNAESHAGVAASSAASSLVDPT